MDLRSVLNASDNGDRGRDRAPPTPTQKHPQPPQSHPAHSPPPQYNYRDFSHPSPHTQPPQPPHGNAYPPQSPYQAPSPYLARRPPPSLQTSGSFQDARSPSSASIPAGGAYRPSTTPSGTPTAAAVNAAGYPFPPSHAPHDAASPSQRHQYPPQPYQHHQSQAQQALGQPPLSRESFSQNSAASHSAGPYAQQQQHGAVPQTPPVGTPGSSSYPYPHQRSQSAHSTPTPTSAQSHHQFGPPHPAGSPSTSAPPQAAEYNRQASHPQTPLGPPFSTNARGPVTSGSFAQPSSPYQQRVSSSGSLAQQRSSLASPRTTSVSQPPQPPHGGPSSYDSPASDSHQRPLSHHDREHSLSVSPKTRVPSLPSNPEVAPSSAAELSQRTTPASQPIGMELGRAVTPAKRKMEDRDMSPNEITRSDTRPPPPGPTEINGTLHKTEERQNTPVPSSKKRTKYKQAPVWAQSARSLGAKLPKHPNFVLQKRIASHLNGKRESVGKIDPPSRGDSPEPVKAQPTAQSVPQPDPLNGAQDMLGQWEPSISGVKPYEEVSKAVADFLFINVLNNEDIQEILGRGISFEIEAKLGTLIDKDTNLRVERRLESECVLQDTGRVAFKSSMTEATHKAFNDFLNQVVIDTDPRNPAGGGRVQVHYKHRREIDRFFDLSPDLVARVPGCMRARLGSRSRNVRVRVTYDQKSREVLNKIIKARVADFDLHIPTCPMDCRISVNLEMNWDGSVEELEQISASQSDRQPDRNKDRLSYSQGHYQIDLTQVTENLVGPGQSQRVEKEHELEIELSPTMVIEQGRKAMSGAQHRYQELVEGFVDNIRVLARKARDLH